MLLQVYWIARSPYQNVAGFSDNEIKPYYCSRSEMLWQFSSSFKGARKDRRRN